MSDSLIRQSWGRFSDAVQAGRTETMAAVLLAAATVAALVWANSPWSGTYTAFWHTEMSVQVAGWQLSLDLVHWVNDALMALFFFVLGLEVKREFAIGELTDRARATIPIVAAGAGLVLPAAIFLGLKTTGVTTL